MSRRESQVHQANVAAFVHLGMVLFLVLVYGGLRHYLPGMHLYFLEASLAVLLVPTIYLYRQLRALAVSKGYSGGWGWMAVLSVVGLMVIESLPGGRMRAMPRETFEQHRDDDDVPRG